MCDQYQNVHAFWASQGATDSAIYHRSDASGTWAPPADVLITREARFLAGAIGPDDTVHLAWITTHGGDLLYTRAPLYHVNDTRRWLEPRALASKVSGSTNPAGRFMAIDKNGAIYIVYGLSDSEGLNHDLLFIRSIDGGQTWAAPASIMTAVTRVSAGLIGTLAIDGKGRLHVGWVLRSFQYGLLSQLGYVRSIDGGRTWGAPRELAASKTVPGVEMIAPFAFGDDEIHLTWDTPDRYHQWSSDGGETWSKPVLIMDLGAAFGGYNQLAKDSAGVVHAIAVERTKVSSTTFDGTAWLPPERIDLREFDYHDQQLAICQGNQLHVIYNDHAAPSVIWYATKSVSAPHIAARSIPAPAVITQKPSPTPQPAADAGSPAGAGLTFRRDAGSVPEQPTGSGILVGIASAFLLCVIGIAVNARRRGL
jgi:hypothetical protein